MKRRIVGFHQDEEAHWVADLDCGHGRHVRHDPPFVERPWVLEPASREARRGETLDCVRCDALEWPPGFAPYRRTPSFAADTIPAALRASHTTKAGVWAKIHVERGRLRYRLLDPLRERELATGDVGIVPPEAPHEVEPAGEVAFYVEFHRRAPPPDDGSERTTDITREEERGMAAFMGKIQAETYAAMRIVTGLLFMAHGLQKLVGWPIGIPEGMMPDAIKYSAGPIELLGGAAVAVGFQTRWAAFLCSGTMAFAYWIGHGLKHWAPIVNQGELAVLYCFVFFYIAARGPGIWSLDGGSR